MLDGNSLCMEKSGLDSHKGLSLVAQVADFINPSDRSNGLQLLA